MFSFIIHFFLTLFSSLLKAPVIHIFHYKKYTNNFT